MNTKTLRSIIGPAISVALIGFACWALYHELKGSSYEQVAEHIKSFPRHRVFLALGLTVVAYWVLTGYDTLALRFIRFPTTYGKTAFTSFISYVFSNNIGMAMIGVSAVRYRLYSAWGMSVLDIAKLIAFCSLTFWLGLFATAGAVFVIQPMTLPASFHLPFASARPLGVLFLAGVGAYLVATGFRKRPLKIGAWLISTPSVWFSLGQLVVASMDWIVTGAILFVLLPAGVGLSFGAFLGMYLLAVSAGLVSHVPGGIGVFEFVFLGLVAPTHRPEVLGALLVYRALYYLLPLCVAAVLLGAHEVILKKRAIRWLGRAFGQWVPELAPHVLGLTVFLGGVALLLSGATPLRAERLRFLERFEPAPVLAVTHVLGSVAAAWLLLLARALTKRLSAAYFMSVIMLAAGMLLCLARGWEYEVALLLFIILAALVPCRGQFYQKVSPLKQPLNTGWSAAITIVVVAAFGLWLFSFESYQQLQEQTLSISQWHFSKQVSLWSCIGALLAASAFAATRIARTITARPPPVTASEMETARVIVRHSRRTCAGLALLGDKRFFFSRERASFIMYGINGRSWIALGDPIGLEEEWGELASRFRDMVGLRGWAAFYDVHEANLPLYTDLGFTVLALGEEARVRLDAFSPEADAFKDLRRIRGNVEEAEFSFQVVTTSEIPRLLADLRRVSDAWLAARGRPEKGFSLGFFNEEYLKQYPVAVVRKAGEVVAFANILTGADREEAAPDMVRYSQALPDEVMVYLFSETAAWAREEGYRWLSLGMSPVSEPTDARHNVLRIGLEPFMFRYGEHFRDFQELRRFKERFRPIFEPRYLACPNNVPLPQLLKDLAALVSHRNAGDKE